MEQLRGRLNQPAQAYDRDRCANEEVEGLERWIVAVADHHDLDGQPDQQGDPNHERRDRRERPAQPGQGGGDQRTHPQDHEQDQVSDPAAHARPVMNRITSRLLVLGLGALVALGVFGAIRFAGSACSPFSRTPCVRVLFLGNSFTFVNDLPTVFRDLARASGQNVETSMVANGGETLAQHVASPDSLNALRNAHWQFVVVQEQSQIPAVESFRQSQMYPAARSLVEMIRTAGSTPILLETWAHRDGWPDQRLDYASMQAGLDQGYATISAELKTALAPTGQAWQAVLRLDPGIVRWRGADPGSA